MSNPLKAGCVKVSFPRMHKKQYEENSLHIMKQNSFQSYLSFTYSSTLSIQSLSGINGPVWRAVSFNFGVNWADTVEYSVGFMVANAVYISDAYLLPQAINLCKY